MPHTPGGTKVLLDPTTVCPTLRGAAKAFTGPTLRGAARAPHTPGGTKAASVVFGTLP